MTESTVLDPATPGPDADPPGAAAPHFAHAHLFADLRGYTGYVEARGDHAGARLIERYRGLVRAVVASERGREIRTEGDSFYVVFDSASAAVRAGQAILAAAADDPDEPVRLGVGVHAGEAVATAEGYVGAAVNLAARVCAQAGAGELVVSDTVRGLTRTYLDVDFVPLGARRLKGVAEPVALFRVEARAVPGTAGRAATLIGQRRVRTAIAIAGAVLAMALLAVIGALLTSRGPGIAAAAASPSIAGSISPVQSPSAAGTTLAPAPTPTPSGLGPALTSPDGPFPSAPEMSLLAELAAVPGDFARTCSRGPYGLVNAGTEGGSERPIASLSCAPAFTTGANSVTILQFAPYTVKYGFASLRLSKIIIDHSAFAANGTPIRIGIPPGNCAKTAAAEDRWSAGGHDAGAILCYTDGSTGDAYLVWSIDQQGIVVSASNAHGDHGALYGFFGRVAPFMANP